MLKTVAITLAAIVGCLAIAFGAACFFAPKFLAECFDGVGAYSASVFFYEKQYEKSKATEDLALLVDKIDGETDSDKAEKYLALLISDDSFDAYCDSQADSGALITLKDYYSGLYATTLIGNGKTKEGLKFCYDYAEQNGYGKNNPYRITISEFNRDEAVLNDVYEALTAWRESAKFTGEQAELLLSDISELDAILK